MLSSTTPQHSADSYYERVDPELKEIVDRDPVCLHLETTPADMSWDLFTRIVDQFPRIERVVLHGVGEPMMVRDLPRMICYLKERGTARR